jgi:quinol monooxygenase YgiN
MPELQVIARHHVAPGNVDAARPAQVVLLERYASREAFAAHRETAHFQDLVLGRIVPLLSGRTVEQYDADER